MRAPPYIVTNSNLLGLFSVKAIAIWPFIFVKCEGDKRILNHESIHIAQYNELYVGGFLALYLADWTQGLAKYRDRKRAYEQIRFEQEAYMFENDLGYLAMREKFAWKKFRV